METTQTLPQTAPRHVLCLRSLFAGLFVAFLTHMILSALGAGIGGMTAHNLIIREEGGGGLATAAGVWMGLSAVVSLYAGCYFAMRVSRFTLAKSGLSHGAVIASIFFVVMAWGASMGLGSVASGLAQTAMAASSGVEAMAQNPTVQDTIQKAIGKSDLRSTPSEVASGLAVRLLRGDTASARAYLAYQTRQSESQVDAQVATLQTEFNQAVKTAGEKTADAVAIAGWSLFVTMVLGLIAAALGGRMGAMANVTKPFGYVVDERPSSTYRAEFIRV